MSKHVVARLSEIPPGGRLLVDVRGRPIVIFNLDGELFGLLNRCPHEGGSLFHGALTGLPTASRPDEVSLCRMGEIIRCPWHGWEFDVRTGKSFCDPARIATRTYPVETEPGTTVVEGPYVAETVTVTAEDEFVVVEM